MDLKVLHSDFKNSQLSITDLFILSVIKNHNGKMEKSELIKFIKCRINSCTRLRSTNRLIALKVIKIEDNIIELNNDPKQQNKQYLEKPEINFYNH